MNTAELDLSVNTLLLPRITRSLHGLAACYQELRIRKERKGNKESFQDYLHDLMCGVG